MDSSPAASLADAPSPPSARWRMLALLAFAELLGMSLWFTASASAEHFRQLWSLTPGQVGGLTTAVQLGFVAGTALAALLNVADLLAARWLFSLAALGAGVEQPGGVLNVFQRQAGLRGHGDGGRLARPDVTDTKAFAVRTDDIAV